MYLLNLQQLTRDAIAQTNLHSTMYLLNLATLYGHDMQTSFTFHYVSIKSGVPALLPPLND